MSKPDEIATRDALERIARGGSDLSRPLTMDFCVAVPDETAGRLMADRAAKLGFETKVDQDPETGEWTCYCTRVLVPAYETVVAIEAQLDSLARDLGGYADGFGTWGNADAPSDEK